MPRGGNQHTDPETVETFGLDPAGVEATCFLCGERVVHPAVYWNGLNGDGMMYLHRECAGDLARGLLRDVAELEQSNPD